MPTKTEAIKAFLSKNAPADLSALYHYGMEVQVNVAQDNGDCIQGEYRGKSFQAYTDGVTTWKPFRIPYNAGATPEYQDREMRFDIGRHAHGIGMTGWDWVAKKSVWVAFDFDDISNHATGLTEIELNDIRERVADVPWVMTRTSTSGHGLHLYVFLDDNNNSISNHTEHAALSRAVLAKLAAVTGFNFAAQIDVCGGNMWVWHRKYVGTTGLACIKHNTERCLIPVNWRDHLGVVKHQAHKVRIHNISAEDQVDVEQAANERPCVPLDDVHRSLITSLEGTDSWWDSDHHLLVTHTSNLATAHTDLGLRGIFQTKATGRAGGMDHNCFLIPLLKGAWICRRFGKGTQEEVTWFTDPCGWTTCFYNRDPDLRTVGLAYGGLERERGGFLFKHAKDMVEALGPLGAGVELPVHMTQREAVVKEHTDGRIVVKIKKEEGEPALEGWELTKDKMHTRIVSAPNKARSEPVSGNYDNVVRHVITEHHSDAGWFIASNAGFIREPLIHARLSLTAEGFDAASANEVLAAGIKNPWTLVKKPFKPEYPGDRQWNRDAPQLLYVPTGETERLHYPTWRAILEHCGESLNDAISKSAWCKDSGVLTGADYLKCWIASMLRFPQRPLPYLFFYGPQESGKSAFHEAISLLFSPGYARADRVLKEKSDFNAELDAAILCVIEEMSFSRDKNAYNKIKDYVTALTLSVHKKHMDPIMMPNMTHWVQCGNSESDCPIFPGDTRIVAIFVGPIEKPVQREEFIHRLRNEACDFLGEIMRIQLPDPHSRLGLPAIETSEKLQILDDNKNALERFLTDHCYYARGAMTQVSEFYEAFHKTLTPSAQVYWPSKTICKMMPSDKYPRGRRPTDSQWCYGNLSLVRKPHNGAPLCRIVGKEQLVPKPGWEEGTNDPYGEELSETGTGIPESTEPVYVR